MIVHDETTNRLLVHAGIPPTWSVKRALKEANKVETALSGKAWKKAIAHMYGNLPATWSKSLSAEERLRFTINGLTRMRFCTKRGALSMEYSGPLDTQPKDLVPWFYVANRKARNTHILFGHWSALGVVEGKNYTALDSGCVWGRRLTAVKLRNRSHPRIRVKCDP